MLIFFFSIPMFLVAVFVLGIAGLAFPALRTIIDIGNTIIDVIYNVASFGLILFIIGIGIAIIAPELSSRASKKRNIPLIVLGIYMCAISTLALLRIRILHRFSFVLLFSVIYLVLLSLIYILKTQNPAISGLERQRCRSSQVITDSPTPLFTPFCRFKHRSK